MSVQFHSDKPEIADATWRELFLWLFRRRHRFRVAGNSMAPLLQPGDLVLVNRAAYRRAAPQPGDIVVARDPRQPDRMLIKRVDAIMQDGRCFLLSVNPTQGTDSRTFGAVPVDHVLGKATCRIHST